MTMTMSMGDKFLPLVGKITHLIDPSDFWLQTGTEADLKNFNEFEQQVRNVARSLPVADVNKLEVGTVVLVCCSTSGSRRAMQWRRAKILRIDREGNTLDVLYTDYGKTEIVPAKQVRWNVPDQIQNHACDCCRCALAGIRPIARSWTTRGIKKFKELVNQKTFKVAPLTFDHDTLKLRVSLYPLDEPSRSVTHEMLDAETGLATDECVREYLKDVTPCSFGEVYGARMEDYNLYGEEEPGRSTSEGIFSEDVEDGGQSWATCSEIYSDQAWATCSDSSTTFPQDKSDDARVSVYRNFFNETGMLPETEVQMGMHQGVGQETASSGQLESGSEERTRTSADSTAVVVPGFNLIGLQQRRMPSAQELQREQDEMQKALRRARLQKDMIECNRALDNLKMEAEHGQKWGNSDLLFLYAGQRPQNSRSSQNHGAAMFSPGMEEDGKGFDDGDHSGIEFDLSPEVSMMTLYPEDKGLTPHEDYIPETVSSLATESLSEGMWDVSDHEENGKELPSSAVPATSKSMGKDAALSQGNQEGRDLLQEQQETVPDEDISQWALLPQPPELHPSWTVEDKEYRIHSYIAAVLKAASQMDEAVTDSVCAAIYCLADVDAERCEAEIKMVLEALLEEAVKFEGVRGLALAVFHSYSSALREELLLRILKDGSIKFIKPAVGKMQAYCYGFIDVLIRLLSEEHDWPVLLKTVIQDFTLNCLEKWIIFNKKGAQTGLPQRQLEDLYMDCAERLLPVSVSKMQESNYEQITFIFDQMREKVLEADVDYSVRSRLLTLLLKFPTPDSTALARVESHIKKSVNDQAVQVDKPLLHGPPSPPTVLESAAERFRAVTMEKGCQTEGFEKEHNEKQSCDMSMQTEALELGLRLHRSSVCSNDSTVYHADNLESAVSVPGRARRRRQALLEHFSKQKQGGEELHSNFSQADYANSSSTTSPDCDPVFTSAAQLYSQQPIKGAQSDPDGVRVESGAEAGLETIADASSVQSTENSVAEKSEKAEITCQAVEPNLHAGEEGKKEKGQLLSQQVLVGKAEKESSEKSQKVSFMSAMSLVSRAAFSAVFGNGKDHSDYSETTHSAAVSDDLECGEQHVAGLQSDILPNKENASSVYTLKDDKVGETHIASGTEKFLDGMGEQRGEVRADTESYNDAFRKSFRDASRVSSLSETKSSSMSTGQQSPPVNYASPMLSSRSVAEDEDGDLSDWDDDFDFSRYAYGGDQSVDNTGVEDASLCGDRTKSYGVEDFSFSGNRTNDYGVEDVGFSGNRTNDYGVEDVGFSGNRTEDYGVEDFGFSGTRTKGYRVEYAGFSGRGHGGKMMFSPEDFPPLPAQPVYRGSDVPEKSQLTLGSIASNLLEESPEKSAEENRVPDSHIKVKGSKFSTAPNRFGEIPAPGFGQSEVYLGEDGDRGSVPSEWEDRVFPSSSVSSDCRVSGSHDASKAGGGDGFAGHYSQGKWLNEESAACRQHKMDPAGDSFTSQLSLASDKINSFPQESRSSPSTPPMVSSPGSSVPYQRGDLTSMFDESHPAKSKGRKKKFRSFDALQPVVRRAPESPGDLLDLDHVVCTNCDEVGHLRSECLKPLNSIFF